MLQGPEGPFFSHLRGPRRERAAADLALPAEAAEAGEAWAARDVSMPGVAGSLLQFCESAGGLGCALDLDALPVPDGVALEDWFLAFPSYGFLLVGDPHALAARAGAAGLTCARVGTLDDCGRLRLRAGGARSRSGTSPAPTDRLRPPDGPWSSHAPAPSPRRGVVRGYARAFTFVPLPRLRTTLSGLLSRRLRGLLGLLRGGLRGDLLGGAAALQRGDGTHSGSFPSFAPSPSFIDRIAPPGDTPGANAYALPSAQA